MEASYFGDGLPAAISITLTDPDGITPGKLFWRMQVTDFDSDIDGLTDYEEFLLGSNPFNAFTTNTSIPDAWIAQHLGHITNIFQYFNLHSPNPGGGGTILESFLSHTDPNQSYGDTLPVWTTVNSGKTNTTDPPAPPVTKQRTVVIPAGGSAFLLVAVASEEFPLWTSPTAQSSQFNDLLTWDIQVSPGSQLGSNLNVNQLHGQWISAVDNQQHLPGMCNVVHYVHTQVIQAPPEQELVLQITVTAENISDNDLASEIAVGILPIEVTAAFAFGPDNPQGAGDQSSRELLEDYLNEIKIAQDGHVWAVNGKDGQGKEKIWVVEIVSDQAKLDTALSSAGRHVVFDGHSNFGIGPEFPNLDQDGAHIPATKIDDYTNYGVGYTDIPMSHRRTDVFDQFGIQNGFLEVAEDEIPAAPINYEPLPIQEERFPNMDEVGINQPFAKQGLGFGTWHYRIAGGSKRLIIDAPNSDLPENLAYKTFFYNACSSGIDYIENFKHGDFIYTNQSCFVHQGTTVFIQGVVEGKTTAQLVGSLNQDGIGLPDGEEGVYDFKSF